MAKAFSVASWNVEHFRGREDRVTQVVRFIAEQKADVIALYEVEGKTVFGALRDAMPGYTFHITEGPQTQEILVGVRKTFDAFFTQRVTFKSGNPSLRPGALLTLTIDGKNYSVLFLHLKSMPSPLGLGLRDDQLERAFKLRRVLDKAAPGNSRANFLFLGDLNTMGMKYRFKRSIPADIELENLDRDAARKSIAMRRLVKTRDVSWWNGPTGSFEPSNLDHVVAADHLEFSEFPRADGTGKAHVDVRGWPTLADDAAKGRWIRDNSDHALLFFVVQKV